MFSAFLALAREELLQNVDFGTLRIQLMVEQDFFGFLEIPLEVRHVAAVPGDYVDVGALVVIHS